MSDVISIRSFATKEYPCMSILYVEGQEAEEDQNFLVSAADGLASAVATVVQGTSMGEQEIDFFILPPPQGFEGEGDLQLGVSQK